MTVLENLCDSHLERQSSGEEGPTHSLESGHTSGSWNPILL